MCGMKRAWGRQNALQGDTLGQAECQLKSVVCNTVEEWEASVKEGRAGGMYLVREVRRDWAQQAWLLRKG